MAGASWFLFALAASVAAILLLMFFGDRNPPDDPDFHAYG